MRDGAGVKWEVCLCWKVVVVIVNKLLLPTQTGNGIQLSLTPLNRYSPNSRFSLTNLRQI